eukprot:5382253-Amphidinium_carterae.1
MSPPTSTTSRGEAPSRSDSAPVGLPDLPHDVQCRVHRMNEIFAFAALLFEHCACQGVLAVCENPQRSYLWRLPMWTKLLRFQQVDADLCAHGDPRPKRVRFLSANMDLSAIRLRCDGTHRHYDPLLKIAWKGVQRAMVSARYPTLLCKRLVAAFSGAAQVLGVSIALPVLDERPALDRQHRRAATSLLSEFKTRITTSSSQSLTIGE